MPTNLQIDDRLLNRAKKIGGFKSKKDAVNFALADYLRRHEQKELVPLLGTIDFFDDYDHKKLRAKR